MAKDEIGHDIARNKTAANNQHPRLMTAPFRWFGRNPRRENPPESMKNVPICQRRNRKGNLRGDRRRNFHGQKYGKSNG
jgi:hypothetical protein